jgi:uncharacterized membrane protein
MSGVLRLVSMAGFLILTILVILTIVAAFGGFEHNMSNPPV